jgi:hypothetical protein
MYAVSNEGPLNTVMKMAMILYLSLCTDLLGAEGAQPPTLTPMERAMAEWRTKEGSANFAAACINLNRDVQEKRITIYSVVPTAKSSTTNIADFSVQTIYHHELSRYYDEVSGSYIQHYNGCVLDFALAQYAEGKKSLGIGLVRLLSQAEPKADWSSPRISQITIKKILESLEADDGSISDVLKESTRDWHQREKDYKP